MFFVHSSKSKMKSAEFEFVIPANQILKDEDIFAMVEELAKRFSFDSKLKYRFIRVSMELFQNLAKHRSANFVSVFKLRLLSGGLIKLITFNIASGPTSKILNEKFQKLKKAEDLRKLFKEKLTEKISSQNVIPGDFGLDLCFRNSYNHELSVRPYKSTDNIIYLSFYL